MQRELNLFGDGKCHNPSSAGRGDRSSFDFSAKHLEGWNEPSSLNGLEFPISRRSTFLAGFSEIVLPNKWDNNVSKGQIGREIKRVSQEFGLSPVSAAVLVSRFLRDGRVNLDELNSYLFPYMSLAAGAYEIKGMREGIKTFLQALRDNRKIIVCADYDVDGVSSAAQIAVFLREIGYKKYEVQIPHRLRDGYGLSDRFIRKAVRERALLLALDIGTDKLKELNKADNLRGIIIDHHIVSERANGRAILINPSQDGCSWGKESLCASGLTYLFLRCAAREGGFSLPLNLLGFAALGTIADVVPLTGVNRVIAREGLKDLENNCGIFSQILASAGLIKKGFLSSEDISYFLAPLLNSAGRLDTAQISLKLLTATSIDEGIYAYRKLYALNERRKRIERQMVMRAIRICEKQIKKGGKRLQPESLVFCHSRNHRGVNGIVASRLADYYHCPVVVLTDRGDGVLEGSARSGGSVDFREVIEAVRRLVLKIGGHSAAGGVRLRADNVGLFKKVFTEICARSTLKGGQVRADIPLNFGKFKQYVPEILRELRLFEPFGNGNRKPVFYAMGVSARRGKLPSLTHWTGHLEQGGEVLEAVFWHRIGHPALVGKGTGKLEIAYSPTYRVEGNREAIVELMGAGKKEG